MFALSGETHKYLIEPRSKNRHIKIPLKKIYIRFPKMLSTSEKKEEWNLFKSVRKQVQLAKDYAP